MKWIMVTLVPQKGKESIAQEIIERIKNQIAPKGIANGGRGQKKE